MQKKNTNEGEKLQYKTLTIEDTVYTTLLTEKYENRAQWIKPDEKRIYSYLPGTLIKLNVKAGDTIKLGQTLLVFEAMKMLNTVKADQAGKIKEILVKPGDKFPKNHLLLEFE